MPTDLLDQVKRWKDRALKAEREAENARKALAAAGFCPWCQVENLTAKPRDLVIHIANCPDREGR